MLYEFDWQVSAGNSAGTLDAHASGKLTGARLDTAMAGTAAEYAAARAKRRTLSPEQESAFSLRTAAAQVLFLPAGPFTLL